VLPWKHGDIAVRGSGDWSMEEVDLLIADYVDMLGQELAGVCYNKTEHRNRLMAHLPRRNKGAIEFKHQNVSAAMLRLKLPYINGYKPRFNYQSLLDSRIRAFVAGHSNLLKQWAESPIYDPTNCPDIADAPWESRFVEAPKRLEVDAVSQPDHSAPESALIDFAEMDARNRLLGERGEEFVVDLERQRLRQQQRPDLASRVRWVSKELGDGLGYDVASYDHRDASELKIEVKSTCNSLYFPFYVTDNEVRTSDRFPDSYRLYRIFQFSRDPKLYVLEGPLRLSCSLEPVVYRARL
jgi:hypothetical protein